MIIVSAASREEAAVVDALLRQLPAEHGYRVYCLGHLTAGYEAGSPQAGQGLHPARTRLRQLLAGSGQGGATSCQLWMRLADEGLGVARETVQRWLHLDEAEGYVFRMATPRSRWIWRWIWRLSPALPAEQNGS